MIVVIGYLLFFLASQGLSETWNCTKYTTGDHAAYSAYSVNWTTNSYPSSRFYFDGQAAIYNAIDASFQSQIVAIGDICHVTNVLLQGDWGSLVWRTKSLLSALSVQVITSDVNNWGIFYHDFVNFTRYGNIIYSCTYSSGCCFGNPCLLPTGYKIAWDEKNALLSLFVPSSYDEQTWEIQTNYEPTSTGGQIGLSVDLYDTNAISGLLEIQVSKVTFQAKPNPRCDAGWQCQSDTDVFNLMSSLWLSSSFE